MDLQAYNTFAVPASCKQFIPISDPNAIPDILSQHQIASQPHFVLGGGSNVLFTQPFGGVVLHMTNKGIAKQEENDEMIVLEVAAGELWEDFVNYCVENQYYGVENLIGIPGLVGSCPVQNIGAYGAEVKDVILSVKGYRIRSAQPFVLQNADCCFGYRTSIFKTDWKNDVIITSVIFKLSKKENYQLSYQALSNALADKGLSLSLKNIADTVIAVRNSKLPDIKEVGCAGSFFKNPIVDISVRDGLLARFPNLVSYPAGEGQCKLAAGQLIDLSGLKGHREGAVGVWPLQALVIVNYGGATGPDVVDFYRKVQARVLEFTGVCIEPEVNVL